MNKVSKIIMAILCILLVSGVAYGITTILKKFTYNNVTMNPSYQSTLDEKTINNLWVGTLDLAWKDLEEKLGVDRIQIEGEEIPQIATDLNASTFSKEMLNPNDYNISVERTLTRGYKIEATLNKELHFLENFDNFKLYTNRTFGDSEEHIKYFGINNGTQEKVNKNVEVLFFNEDSYVKSDGNINYNDFAVKLKTREGDEIILYRTDDKKNFDEYYEDVINKTESYEESKDLIEGEEIYIPYIRIKGLISYNELFGKEIKETNGMYIADVIQNVDFYLNEKGCNLSSKATMLTEYMGIALRTLDFNDTFILFIKEKNAEMPYFTLKVDNTDILEKIDENQKPVMLYDDTMFDDFEISNIEPGEYKFYEDDKYEYYYPIHKTEFVKILCEEGEMTAEEALKRGIITIDLLDDYEVEYIKKEKNK